MRLIDADRLLTEFKERAEAAKRWQEAAKDEEIKIRAAATLDFLTEVKLTIEKAQTVCGNNPKWCESCVSNGKCASTRQSGEWIPINEETIKILQDRNYYLIAHKDYTTPLKAKFYKDLTSFFKVCTFSGNFVTYFFEEENNEITHFMELSELPKKEIFCPNCDERLEG